MDENRTSTAERLRRIMMERGLKQVDVLRLVNPVAKQYDDIISPNTLSQYVSGKVVPRQNRLFILAKALNVSEAWLMGLDVDQDRSKAHPEEALLSVPDLMPIVRKKFPLLGEVACGEPTYAEEEHETLIESTENIDADFCLRAKGDSMTGSQINDGDIVFIKQMPMVDNGDIAAVLIENETTLKRVDYNPDAGLLILMPDNPAFRPLVYKGEELSQVRILGRAVMIQKIIRKR